MFIEERRFLPQSLSSVIPMTIIINVFFVMIMFMINIINVLPIVIMIMIMIIIITMIIIIIITMMIIIIITIIMPSPRAFCVVDAPDERFLAGAS